MQIEVFRRLELGEECSTPPRRTSSPLPARPNTESEPASRQIFGCRHCEERVEHSKEVRMSMVWRELRGMIPDVGTEDGTDIGTDIGRAHQPAVATLFNTEEVGEIEYKRETNSEHAFSFESRDFV